MNILIYLFIYLRKYFFSLLVLDVNNILDIYNYKHVYTKTILCSRANNKVF